DASDDRDRAAGAAPVVASAEAGGRPDARAGRRGRRGRLSASGEAVPRKKARETIRAFLVWAADRDQARSAVSEAMIRLAAWTTAPMRRAAWIWTFGVPCLRSSPSWASMQAPQPLMADTAVDHSSKSSLSTPGLPMTFMRSLAGRVVYS